MIGLDEIKLGLRWTIERVPGDPETQFPNVILQPRISLIVTPPLQDRLPRTQRAEQSGHAGANGQRESGEHAAFIYLS